MKKQEIFSCEGLYKTFISTKAVDDVSITIDKGEIRGLIGENGSGKSTMVSIIAGILKQDEGRMVINGAPYSPRDQIDANNHGVSIIVQEMSTIEGLSVAENIFLGVEKEFLSGGMINKKKMNQKARLYLERFGISDIDIDRAGKGGVFRSAAVHHRRDDDRAVQKGTIPALRADQGTERKR